MINTVIKIGGSLGQNPDLPELMCQISKLGVQHQILVIPGGGAFANAVREYDQRFCLDYDTSHWMSIRAMDQFGCMISSMCSDNELVQGIAEARKVVIAGRVPVLLTHNLLYQADELPRSWDVTSDSIAAWVADLVRARQLILLKSVDGLFTHDPCTDVKTTHGIADFMKTINLNQLDLCRGVDRYFATILKKTRLDVWVVNGRHPERLVQLLNTGVTKGTHLLRSDFSAVQPECDSHSL